MKLRSFIAVDPSPKVVVNIARTIEKMEKVTRGFRWVRPEAMHLTLQFLGEVEEEVAGKIIGRIEPIVAAETPISLAASGIGFFPDPSRPRILWVGLQGETGRLENLQRRIEEAIRDLPVHQEKERGFKPHLTVARIRDFHQASGVAAVLKEAKSADFGEFRVGEVLLYKSDLTPKGARYTRLKEFKLGACLPEAREG